MWEKPLARDERNHGDCRRMLPKPMITVVGVDVGKTGAIALIGHFGSVSIWETPMIKGKGKSEYDLQTLVNEIFPKLPRDPFFFVEKTQPMPPKMGGSVANFHRGVGRGWEWMLAGMRHRYQLVSPRTWQKEMLKDVEGKDTKQKSLVQAKRLFPKAKIGKHHGISDALLIAEYGRRQLGIL